MVTAELTVAENLRRARAIRDENLARRGISKSDHARRMALARWQKGATRTSQDAGRQTRSEDSHI